jgi:hypothetical protein
LRGHFGTLESSKRKNQSEEREIRDEKKEKRTMVYLRKTIEPPSTRATNDESLCCADSNGTKKGNLWRSEVVIHIFLQFDDFPQMMARFFISITNSFSFSFKSIIELASLEFIPKDLIILNQ